MYKTNRIMFSFKRTASREERKRKNVGKNPADSRELHNETAREHFCTSTIKPCTLCVCMFALPCTLHH